MLATCLVHVHGDVTCQRESHTSLPFQISALGVKGPAPFWFKSAPLKTGIMDATMMVPNTARMKIGSDLICSATGFPVVSSFTNAMSMAAIAPRPFVISGTRPPGDIASATVRVSNAEL